MQEYGDRLYVLTDETLPTAYAAVQGAHAVAQYLLEKSDDEHSWKNETLIFLKADIKMWLELLEYFGYDFTVFREPDLDNRVTAIAVYDSSRIFKQLELLS